MWNKTEFERKYVDRWVIVHCSTKELSDEFLQTAQQYGYFTDATLVRNHYMIYKEYTGYDVSNEIFVDIRERNMKNIVKFKGWANEKFVIPCKMCGVMQNQTCEKTEYVNYNGQIYCAECLIDDILNIKTYHTVQFEYDGETILTTYIQNNYEYEETDITGKLLKSLQNKSIIQILPND